MCTLGGTVKCDFRKAGKNACLNGCKCRHKPKRGKGCEAADGQWGRPRLQSATLMAQLWPTKSGERKTCKAQSSKQNLAEGHHAYPIDPWRPTLPDCRALGQANSD